MTKQMLILLFIVAAKGFYIPGLAPNTYCEKEQENCQVNIPIYTNRLVSQKSVFPYDYAAFDFCSSSSSKDAPSENLGQVLFGERIRTSRYELTFKVDEFCEKVCTKEYKNNSDKLEFLKHGMFYVYENRWMIDDMPVAWCYNVQDGDAECSPGFPVGCYFNEKGTTDVLCSIAGILKNDTYYLYNHVDITIKYHRYSRYLGLGYNEKSARLVQATLVPRSFAGKNCRGPSLAIPAIFKSEFKVDYTYSVKFEEDPSIKWISRWDYILNSARAETNILPFSVLNSCVVVLFLSGMIAMIVLKRLCNTDIVKYDEVTLLKSRMYKSEKFGWRLLHRDLFRPPPYPALLSACVGVGSEVIAVAFVTLIFACLGILSPASRGALEQTILNCFVIFGVVAGYVSSRLYKCFGGENWKAVVLMTSFLVSGTLFIIFFLMNLVFWSKGSSAAVPLSTLIVLLGLWLGVSVPLTFIGSYFGYKKQSISYSVNRVPRPVPEQSIFLRPLSCMFMGGILPFSCISIQIFFIFGSIWFHRIYYQFAYVFIVACLLVLTCSETSILCCYFHLSAEDYRWWWRSFLTSGFTAVYFFIYAIHFYYTKLTIEGFASAMIYFGCTLIMAILLFLFTGAVGFTACYWFVSKIYNVTKPSEEVVRGRNDNEI